VIYDQSGERYEVTKDGEDVIVHLDERDLRIEMDTLTHVYRGNEQTFFVMGIAPFTMVYDGNGIEVVGIADRVLVVSDSGIVVVQERLRGRGDGYLLLYPDMEGVMGVDSALVHDGHIEIINDGMRTNVSFTLDTLLVSDP